MRYTLDVVASLAMVESNSPSIALVDGGQKEKFPAYTDAGEEPLFPTDVDVESTLAPVPHKPITHGLRATLRHLRRVGGFFAYWRGLHISIMYGLSYAFLSNILSSVIFGRGLFGNVVVSMLTSLLLVRLHMLLTHRMIAYPRTESSMLALVPRTLCKPLILPTLAYAAAQQAMLLLAHLLDLSNSPDNALRAIETNDTAQLASLTLRVLAVLLSAGVMAFYVLLPARATLTRVEAFLLPEDAQPLVPLAFDVDLTACGSSRALFAAAWRSFDTPARLHMLKLYAKILGLQTVVSVFGMMVMAGQVYLIRGDSLGVFWTSARAQLQLMALGAQ
jgi:hypothetical protein